MKLPPLFLRGAMLGVILGTMLACPALAQQAALGGGKVNLLTNGSFESGLTGWEATHFNKRGTAGQDTVEKKDGQASLVIENLAADDSYIRQKVVVKPKTRYRLTGYIKTKDIVGKGAGACFSLTGTFEKTEPIAGTKSWTKVSFEFDSGPASDIMIGPRMGHQASPVLGKAWFDEITLVELGPTRKR